jgi:DNA-binding HxlR family transcriptional regulator
VRRHVRKCIGPFQREQMARHCLLPPAYAFYRFATGDCALAGDRVTDIGAFREAALHCPLPPAVELIGEKWAFLILRGALNGLQHFEEFQAGLGIARNILSERLAKLVAGGILARSPDASDKRRVIYALTDKGRALLPVVLALRQWGEQWDSGPAPVVLADRLHGRPIRRICIHAEDGRELELGDLVWLAREDTVEADETSAPFSQATNAQRA